MNRSTGLPLSPRYVAALAHIADLRAEAERVHVAQAFNRTRPRRGWPRAVVTALRDSIVGLPARRVRTEGAGHVCATC